MESPYKYGNGRHEGLDLLRILAMLMIVFWHFYMHALQRDLDGTGVYTFASTAVSLANYAVTEWLALLCSICVNVYVLITGYFLLEKPFRFGRILRVWFQALFTGAVIVLLFCLLQPEQHHFGEILSSLNPFRYGGYWFVKCYVRLLLVSPLLVFVAHRLSYKGYVVVLLLMVLTGTTVAADFPFGYRFPFRSGFSLPWFCYLFLTGCYLRRFPLPNWASRFSVFFAVLTFTAAAWCLPGCFHGGTLSPAVSLQVFAYNGVSYFLSVLFFGCFAQLQLSSARLKGMVAAVGPLTFGVYLLHDHELVRQWLWYDGVAWQQMFGNPWFPMLMISVSTGVFVLCLGADYCRRQAFAYVGIDRLLARLGGFFDRLLSRLVRQFGKLS